MSKRSSNKTAQSPAPDAATLHAAALTYLARYAATEAGLRRILERRVDRWARGAQSRSASPDEVARATETARQTARDIVARLAAVGAVSDAAFAESKARRLIRSGHSHRAAAAQLTNKGVDPETALAVLQADEKSELAAALVFARRRRIGPFRPGAAPDAAERRRELGVLARAGFPPAVARHALAMDVELAETLVSGLQR